MQAVSREIVGAFIFSQDGLVLLGKNRSGGVYEGLWTIPGGGVEAGEDNLAALKREILEEVNLDISDASIMELNSKYGTSTKKSEDGTHDIVMNMHFHDYKVTLDMPASEYSIKSGDDFSLARWFSASELNEFDIAEPAKKTLALLFS